MHILLALLILIFPIPYILPILAHIILLCALVMVALINTNRKMYLAPVSIAITTMMMPNI